MNIRPWIIGPVLAGLVATAQAQPAADNNEQAWQQHWQQMQEYRQAWENAKTPDERQKLRDQHWQSMRSGFGMMSGCPMGQQGGGMGKSGGMGMQGGMNGGPMMGMQPSKEMLDLRIKHMEQMLEQMRSHRNLLDKS
ncbi:hypothetical protein [Stutzerimonas xanthomarina]|uniref:hypothetical protein n=1 Tax=Stutzerimonas xanthomarina TaxID=271420 RepID=UPI003AA7DCA0